MTANLTAEPALQTIPPLLRVAGKSLSITEIFTRAASLPVTLLDNAGDDLDDPAAVDLTLHVARIAQPGVPAAGVAYSGLTPAQRRAFLDWAANPLTPAPAAFRRLYIANLELHLFTDSTLRTEATSQLVQLVSAPAWNRDPWCAQALLLALWLVQQGNQLAAWLRSGTAPADLLGVALGHLAILNTQLDAHLLGILLTAWKLAPSAPSLDLLKLRLSSLATTLGNEPLAYALAALGEGATMPHPWRTAHRGLRIALPQPDLRPVLEKPLRDMLTVPMSNASETTDAEINSNESDNAADTGWTLILEFGHSRSEYFDDVLNLSRRLPGYSQILDEDRRVIYRVVFRKSEMRRFWRIWEYAQSWSSTRVYVNGQELEPWKVWPYSQYLR